MSEQNPSQSPGVFRGNARLATYQQLEQLKEYVERLIAGPINEVGDNGYIPWKFKADGTLDVDYLFPELVEMMNGGASGQPGIAVKLNGVNFSNNISAINFQGKYVSLDVDENGCLVCNIDDPSVTIPNFNEANTFGDALVKIDNEIIEDMIVPDVSHLTQNSVYGDWTPGKKVKGINWNKNNVYDNLNISTNGAVYAGSLESYFEVKVTDGSGSTFATFTSIPIRQSTLPGQNLSALSLQSNPNIKIYISDFKEEASGYSFKPTFEINLIAILGQVGGRFNVKITHHNGDVPFTYVSPDLLYNCGVLPTMTTPTIQLVDDASAPITYRWCSGIKYAANGMAYVRLNNVNNLNNMAAVENPVEYNFNIANKDESELIVEDYDYKIDKVASFKIKLKFDEGILNNQNVGGKVKLKNAFGESNEYTVNAPILLNSQTNLKYSDQLNEYFSDESFRLQTTAPLNGASNSVWDSTRSLTDIDSGRGLMVVPGVGLQYPYGNWSVFFPNGSPDYSLNTFSTNEKYFVRMFEGDQSTKFGGIFKFEGLTKEQFEDERLSVLISDNLGASWMNLKLTRNMKGVVLKDDGTALMAPGVLIKVEEYEDGVYVHWAYPANTSSSYPLMFKLGMKPTAPFCIKSISLLNTDKEEEW